MSFVEGIGPTLSFDLADPTFLLCAWVALVLVCLVLDAPAIATVYRFLRRKRRLAKSRSVSSAHSRRERRMLKVGTRKALESDVGVP